MLLRVVYHTWLVGKSMVTVMAWWSFQSIISAAEVPQYICQLLTESCQALARWADRVHCRGAEKENSGALWVIIIAVRPYGLLRPSWIHPQRPKCWQWYDIHGQCRSNLKLREPNMVKKKLGALPSSHRAEDAKHSPFLQVSQVRHVLCMPSSQKQIDT